MASITPETTGRWMKSRRQRRRDRRRVRLRCTGNAGGALGAGVLSDAWGDHLTRGDLSLLRTAIRRDWEIGEQQRLAFVDLTWATFERVADIPRHSIAVAATVISMAASNQRHEQRAIAEFFSIDRGKQS